MKNNQFNNIKISQEMINHLKSIGYESMTPIQEKSLPILLDNQDLIAKAKTGSGKTATYGISLIHKLNVKRFRIQSIVLAPTRELAEQIAIELRKIAKYIHNVKIMTLCGGVPYKPQVHSLSHQAHIIVGTPGRVLKHLQDSTFSTQEINSVVLDESDRMLDMGFFDDINAILEYLPKKRQNILLSATYSDEVKVLANNLTTNAKYIEIDSSDKVDIKELFYRVESTKKEMLLSVLSKYKPSSTIIFCNTKIECNELADELDYHGVSSVILHSDFEQRDRIESLLLFKNGSYPVLIATDIAGRGIDVDDVELVVNYDLPNEVDRYIHRIGRTARAGKDGIAISFTRGDGELVSELEEYRDTKINIKSLDINIDKELSIEGAYSTLYISGGKKQKIRAGDILGAITSTKEISGADIADIDILPMSSYVAIKKSKYKKAYNILSKGKIKGKFYRIYKR
jgi:ATP-independent RNA helicase DbpA